MTMQRKYWLDVRPRSLSMPATFALPIAVRSWKFVSVACSCDGFLSYHIREAVKNPDGRHQVQINFAHQLPLFLGLLFKRRGHKLEFRILGRYGFLVMESILLDVCGREIANRSRLILPESMIWVVWRHCAEAVVKTGLKRCASMS
jgi:hypothetical protein